MPRRAQPLIARLLARSAEIDGCLVWQGALNQGGYGIVSLPGGVGQRLVHRAAWEAERGPLARDVDLDHTCRRRACWRLEHLDPVSHQVNLQRSALGYELTGRCRSGEHDMTDPANVYVAPSGGRRCRACKLASNQAQARRRRAATQED